MGRKHQEHVTHIRGKNLGNRMFFWEGPHFRLSRKRLQNSYYFKELKKSIHKILKENTAISHQINNINIQKILKNELNRDYGVEKYNNENEKIY